ncbi:TetR/AcrR family transcriptional regulator [Moraxella sp. ZJ142]|uniref:TetR/AcrR family transcriptional regulator n=1 Tax=Moraxella marmotae TaxID=3344520 RepID=UPI0035D4236B
MKEFEQIAVQDIVDLAMVNRATFYKYYSGKSDLAGALISEFKEKYQTALEQKFGKDNNIAELMNNQIPALYAERQTILALWKIKTKRHHLYDDMFLMIKNNYITYQKQLNPNQNFDYQGQILATIILNTARYYFEKDLPIPVKQVWADIEMTLKTVQAA